MSPSMTACPARARAPARLVASVLLPTPPLGLATAITRMRDSLKMPIGLWYWRAGAPRPGQTQAAHARRPGPRRPPAAGAFARQPRADACGRKCRALRGARPVRAVPRLPGRRGRRAGAAAAGAAGGLAAPDPLVRHAAADEAVAR